MAWEANESVRHRPSDPASGLCNPHPLADSDVLARVLAHIDPAANSLRLLRRNGRVLLGLPAQREAAGRALGLYQPQRLTARAMTLALRQFLRFGLQACLLPKVSLAGEVASCSPAFPAIEAGSCGILLGSPEHRVRRAIASYRIDGKWEVAKISFGEAGARILEQEARSLHALQSLAEGVPDLLGLHRGSGVTILRMPYLRGRPIQPGDSEIAIELLTKWAPRNEPRPIASFPGWLAVSKALHGIKGGIDALRQLSGEVLRPVICHGDFARWNLRKSANGDIVVLDWEWSHSDGIPGIDLVHYFLQDARLVDRLSTDASLDRTCSILKSRSCNDYLAATGWKGDPILTVIASLAYKQGEEHQENGEILQAAVARLSNSARG